MYKFIFLFFLLNGYLNSASQVFNKIIVNPEYLPLRMPIGIVDKNHIFMDASVITKNNDSSFKLVIFDSIGNISDIVRYEKFQDGSDSFYYFDDIESYQGQLYGFGYMYYNYQKTSDSIWASYKIVCPLDNSTFKPKLNQKKTLFLGYIEQFIGGNQSYKIPILNNQKIHYTQGYRPYSVDFKTKSFKFLFTNFNFKTNSFIKKEFNATDNLYNLGGHFVPYDSFFLTFVEYDYHINLNRSIGCIYKFDYNFNFIDSSFTPYIDSNLKFRIDMNSFMYNIKRKNKVIGFQQGLVYTRKANNPYIDSFGIYVYSLDKDSLRIIKRIETFEITSNKYFGGKTANDIVENPDGSFFLTFWHGSFNNALFRIIKLDSNYNTIWSKIYKDTPGLVHNLESNSLMRALSDSNGGMLVPFMGLDETNTNTLFILWIDKDGNTKKMGLKDLTPSSIYSSILGDITLYPNPASTFLNIDGLRGRDLEYQISDLSGRKLLANKLDKQHIDVTNLVNGVYFLDLKTKNGMSVVKKFEIRR